MIAREFKSMATSVVGLAWNLESHRNLYVKTMRQDSNGPYTYLRFLRRESLTCPPALGSRRVPLCTLASARPTTTKHRDAAVCGVEANNPTRAFVGFSDKDIEELPTAARELRSACCWDLFRRKGEFQQGLLLELNVHKPRRQLRASYCSGTRR